MDTDREQRNGGGRIGGSARIGRGLRRVALLLAMAAPALAQTRYTAVDLGGLGPMGCQPFGINASGQVVGFSYPTAGLPTGSMHAFLYSGGAMIDLGTLGGSKSWAFGVSASGQVVGWSDLPDGHQHAFLYTGGAMMDLGTLGGSDSWARAINDSGQVVGWAAASSGESHAFLYSGGAMIALGTLDASLFGDPWGINAGGQVVGQSDNNSTSEYRAFLYSDGTMIDLGTLGGLESLARGINASGQVVGYSQIDPLSLDQHAFLYSGGAMIDLGTLGATQSDALGINASGQVVGRYYSNPPDPNVGTRAFLYSGGTMTDLSNLVTLPPFVWLGQATAINDRGQIAAWGSDGHGYLLTPGSVSEPVPTISSLSPSSAAAGGPAFTLTVNGTNFLSGAVVKWNGAALVTTFVSATQLTASVPAALIVAPGAANVTVMNPGGATSTAAIFAIVSPPSPPILISPANRATGVLLAPTLTWLAAAGATSYDVYFGTSSPPPWLANTTGTSYAPGALSAGTTYYWQIAARNAFGTASSETWSFTTGVPAVGSRFVPVAPCRVADTRGPAGPFAGPTMTAGSTRSFAIPQSACGIPSTAQAYSLNVTVVPSGPLGYLSLWPTGQPQPLVSTLNSFGGIVVANAALVPAGSGGAVSVYVSNQTDVILDINGYFDSSGSSFYPATPCRVADTRGATGQFGGPSMFAGQSRDFPVPLSSCAIPATATAYSLNVTAVPDAGVLSYLTTWPTGQAQPNVSTLNSWTGKIVANAALVPAGSNGSVSVFVTNPADVILDINGYFGQPGNPGALAFYPVTPCRVADTRNSNGPFGGPEMAESSARSFAIPASACNVPSTAAAYSLNITVVPDGPLSYLTTWPTGSSQPYVSTLNSFDGAVVANAALVPAGTAGAISVFVTNHTHVILDINGYFAP